MKTMTCKQLGGACDKTFTADNFDEMAQQSQQHGQEMAEAQDADHLAAMGEMKEMMKDPSAMQAWMDGKKKEFEELEED